MAKLTIGILEVNKECQFNGAFKTRMKVAICSECQKMIYSPSNGVVYNYCYHCGAKFDTPVGAKEIREIKKA